jgi:enoyl-CoA hydratase/carnithine racemase
MQLPRSLRAERRDDIAMLFLARTEKRNAIDDPTVFGIEAFFAALPDDVKAVVLAGEGEHFCSGLDLGELTARDVAQGIAHSRSWHRAFERIEFGKVPVVAVLHGAVVGGGLEIAAACHIRVADASAYYALPEGSRGIFVGGGGSVRLPRLIGTARMMDMMLTGRIYDAEDGQAIGISHYLVARGAGLAKGIELARRIASNAPMTNFAVTHVLPRIAESDPASGYLTEALISAIAQGDDEAKARLKAFLEKRAPKTTPGKTTVHGKTARS